MLAGQLAQQLDVQKSSRQVLTRTTQEKAESLAMADESNPFLLFAVDEEFNPGVVGLAAFTINRNTLSSVVVAPKVRKRRAVHAARFPEFHITDALDQCADLLVRHGGHAAAADSPSTMKSFRNW